MVSGLDSRSRGPGLSPGREHCVVFLGKTLEPRSNDRNMPTQHVATLLGAQHVATCCVAMLRSFGRGFSHTVPLSTQVYKWVPANLMLGEPCDGLASHPGRSRNTLTVVASCC